MQDCLGMSNTSLYRCWRAMRERTTDPHYKFYAAWGGRGIDLDPRWHVFSVFYADMGPKPSPKHSLDRIDNNRGYWPNNCRWATAKEQANNRRNSVILTLNGRRQTVAQWADELGLSSYTIYYWRINKGQSVKDALRPRRAKMDLQAIDKPILWLSPEGF